MRRAAHAPHGPDLPPELEPLALDALTHDVAQTDFLEAGLESVRFHDCDLTRADFRGARLQGCEFRRCDLTGLEGVASLRGAALEWPAIVELAGVFAAALGVEVLDAD